MRTPAGRLERSCGAPRTDWVQSGDAAAGVQLLRAWFAGHGYDRHRHDTYAIGVTDVGLQVFDYRGATETSTPGRVAVLHPDEAHDGRAGTSAGFGYHIVYVAPSRIAEAARAIRGRVCALPFARAAVSTSRTLARAVDAAFQHPLEPLAVDRLILRLAEGLLEADPSSDGAVTPTRVDTRAVGRARAFLDAETTRVVQSAELEAVTGLTRYDLARQFRAAVGTSPYRYSLMRRLERARTLLHERALAEVALATGFADQAHFSRAFKAAFGVTPGRFRTLEASRC